uniref:Coronin n=2 Tax=Heterosigma akashiwo TaxID=2829 RepID=A0A7S4D4C1_HETAK
MCAVPKRGLDVMRCETARLLKLTSSSVEPLSFIVPRKSDAFQEDLFPPTFAGRAAHTADEWLAGSTLPPVTMSLDPAQNGTAEERKSAAAAAAPAFAPKKPPAQLQTELDEALARIQVLEQRLREAGLDTS